MKVTKRMARRIFLFDDETEYGGTAHINETLDEFMASAGIPYGTDVETINSALKECGIQPIKINQL